MMQQREQELSINENLVEVGHSLEAMITGMYAMLTTLRNKNVTESDIILVNNLLTTQQPVLSRTSEVLLHVRKQMAKGKGKEKGKGKGEENK